MLFPFILSILAISVLATPVIHAPGRIAFVSDRDGNLEIYSMNPDGSNQVRLTNNPGVDTYPTWSPDGRTIAFIRQSATGEYSLSVMNSDGSRQRDVTRIPYQATPYPWREKANLSWSPDGRKIVFAGGSGLAVVTVDNGAVSTILESSGFTDIEPAWSPDGSRIIFVSSRDAYMTLHTVRPDGRDLQSLPSSGDRWDMSPDWSPTGERIVFIVHSEESVPSIYMANTA